MAILKNNLKQNFTQIPNHIILSDLGNEAFRLLVYLYSKPDNWKIYQKVIAKEFGVSRQTVNKWFAELKEKCFISIEKKTIKGKFDYVYQLMDGTMSNIVDTVTVSSLTDTESNGHGTNLTYTNTNLTNTDITNTKRDILLLEEVSNIYDAYVALQEQEVSMYLNKEKDLIIKRILFNLDESVKNIKRYVTTVIENEVRRYNLGEELNHFKNGNISDANKLREFSTEEKKIAQFDWEQALSDEEGKGFYG